jgi:hypothetical protein
MCRKLIVLALVVVVGLVVLKRTELGRLVRVWWHGSQAQLEASIPLETRIEQLKLTIADAEKQLKKLKNKQAKLEVASDLVKEEVDAVKATQTARAAKMKRLIADLDGKVSEGSDDQKQLDRLTREYTSGKALLRAKEETYAIKKQTADEAAEQRQQLILKIADLNVLVAQMEARLAKLRSEQRENAPADAADVAEAQRLVALIDRTLRESEKEKEIDIREGQVSVKPETTQQSRAESVKAAQQALRNDE